MNNDLISRSALLVVPNVNKVTEYDEAGFGMSYNAVSVETIEAAPAVDAVEVVRCRDCVWYCPGWIAGKDICGKIMNNGLTVSPDFFCKHGELREDTDGKSN